MPEQDPADRAWQLMEKVGLCMLVTLCEGQMRARPMGATVKRGEHAIYFLTDANSTKDQEIEDNAQVLVTFADTGGQKYVAVAGMASVSNDRAKIKQIWSPVAKAWWDNADDPNIRLITVRPQSAEYWDSPGTVVSFTKMIAAAVTGAKPEVGQERKVRL